jgi:signal transduction histidine kinase/CheY-like chemotaxis protein
MTPVTDRPKAPPARSWPRASLRTYLVAVTLLATLPVAALMCVQIFANVRQEQARTDDLLARTAATLSNAVDAEMQASFDALRVLALPDPRQPAGRAGLERRLRSQLHPRPEWDSLFLMDRAGAIVFDTAGAIAPTAPQVLELQRRVLGRARPAASGLVDGAAPHVVLAVPVLADGGAPLVLAARVGVASWQRLALGAQPPPGAMVSLFGPDGLVITRSGAVPLPAQATDGARYSARQVSPVSGWQVAASLPAAPVASAASLLLGVLLAALAARQVTRPLHQLAVAGPAGLAAPLPVYEIALLRDALLRAHDEDLAARSRLEARAQEAERERVLLTDSAVAARLEAESASRAKDEFLTMLSHELRNPLGAISAAIDVLDSAPAAGETAAEARSIIGRQTRNLSHMMNDLLDVSRVIAGKISLSRQPVELAAIVQRVRQTLLFTGAAARHTLTCRLASAWADGDAVRIEQVVGKLVANALTYTPPGGEVVLSVRRDGADALIEVQDRGEGISDALLPHIFELFVQGERPLDRRAGGLGIGLTLVRRLVELHGGTVGVDTSPEGSRFTVRLPAVEPAAVAADDSLPLQRRRKVLVVEDNQDVLAALRAKLELDGHAVHTAADGHEGLTRLLTLRPEVSIVDIGLPGLTGFELARQARAAGYAGRMIALSGYGHERDIANARVAGFDAYLVKPVDRKQLRASMSDLP